MTNDTDFSDLPDRALLGYFQDLLEPPPPGAIRELRKRTGLSRPDFGEELGVAVQRYKVERESGTYLQRSCRTLESWERGDKTPSGDSHVTLRETAREVLG